MGVRSDSAVLFDLDGTIVDTEPACVAALRDTAEAAGLHLGEARCGAFVGRAWEAIFAELGAVTGLGAERFGRRALSRYEALLREELPTVPGAVPLIRALRGQLRLALVTGSTPTQARRYLAQLGILGCFELVLGDGQYAHSKPHPAGYALAMRHLGVRPERSLVFEDSTAGIRSALAAGATVVAVEHARHHSQDQSAAQHRVRDLRGLDVGWCLERLG